MAKDKEVETQRLLIYKQRSRERMIMRKKIRAIKMTERKRLREADKGFYWEDY